MRGSLWDDPFARIIADSFIKNEESEGKTKEIKKMEEQNKRLKKQIKVQEVIIQKMDEIIKLQNKEE